jgi:hypothetical protein
VQRRPPEAVTCHVLALASRLATKSPQAALDARALLNLRTQLDKIAFEAAVSSVVDEASSANLTALLDDWS